MTLIPTFLPHFRSIARNTKFTPEDETSIHPVLYFFIPEIKGSDIISHPAEVYFYKPIGSFIYYVHILSTDLLEDITIDSLKQEFNAEEIPRKLYQTHIELTGTISK
ncbi:hypothetical protein LCGC14_0625740 [marine sediment metagenome]|uniref:Uncharacterized protein n=1 Tax=marine sediment metagenome TaxID=412755 RepID=A0A0F9R3D2_9ZZZZ